MFLAVLLTAYVWKNGLILGTTDATKVVEGSAKGAVAGAKNAMKR
ncbi:MAG: hypothetical protein ABIT70_11540 [Sulfuriferula sp.]